MARTACVAALIERARRWVPDRPALVWRDGQLTYAALAERVDSLAAALAAAGVEPGDRIVLSAPNTWRYVVALLAAWRAGACVAPVDPRLAAPERAAVVADLEPSPVDPVALLDAGPPRAAGRAAPAGGAPDTTDALVLYTSGSTASSKGAVHGHAGVAAATRAWAGPIMRLDDDDVVLAVLPLSHAYGLLGALLAPLLAGATVALVEQFDPDAVLDSIARHRVSVFPGVATMFARLLDAPALTPSAVGTLRVALAGAAPCPWDLARRWRERTGVRILRGYGSTELFRPISYCWGDTEDDPEAVGRPVPGVEVRVAPDGELLVRAPWTMRGYWRAPEATREVLTGKWYATGDLARLTDTGLVAIIGRKRERILRGGYSVFPQEVEAALTAHAAVAEAAVVGVAHPELGEEIAAFVVLRAGVTVAADELIAFCRGRLAPYEYPRTVTFVESLPRALTGKILKARLAPRA